MAGCTSTPTAQENAAPVAPKAATPKAAATAPDNMVVARRPSFPFRVWYAGSYTKNPEWYPNLTLETSGRGDVRTAEKQGISHLNWVYGTQISWNAGPEYWIEHSALGRRMAKANDQYDYPFMTAGISVDEWTGSTEEKRQWVVKGLREAKKQNPDLFVAMWVAGVSKEVAELAREGTVDLIIVQAYNLTVKRGIGVGWGTAFDRMDVAKKEGVENKTVFGFGHITSDANWKGGFVWTEEMVRQRMGELKARYPQMPGIGFFEAGAQDREAHAKTVQLFDRLSAEYWPDTLPLNGTFSLTPQSATKTRLRLPDDVAAAGAKAVVRESELDRAQLWNFKPIGAGVYQIAAPYDDSLVLTAGANNSIALQKAADTAAQKWKLSKVLGGYTIAPQSNANLRLQTGGEAIQLAPAKDGKNQIWAASPEYLLPPKGTTVFTTNRGVGGETGVQVKGQKGRDWLMAVKNEARVENARKGYMRFDLADSPQAVQSAANAELSLTIGKASGNSPADKTWNFQVYGVRNDANWHENDITWEDAPANDQNSGNGVTGNAVLLGNFSIVGAGKEGDTVNVATPELTKFIKADADRLLTFIVVRQEPSVAGKTDDIAHTFATRNNSILASPTLTLTTQP